MLFAAWPISPSLMGCHIILNLSHQLREREKDRGYIKGPHYIQDDFGAWTCVLEDKNSEVQRGFRFFPLSSSTVREPKTNLSPSPAVRISHLQVKYNVSGLIRNICADDGNVAPADQISGLWSACDEIC